MAASLPGPRSLGYFPVSLLLRHPVPLAFVLPSLTPSPNWLRDGVLRGSVTSVSARWTTFGCPASVSASVSPEERGWVRSNLGTSWDRWPPPSRDSAPRVQGSRPTEERAGACPFALWPGQLLAGCRSGPGPVSGLSSLVPVAAEDPLSPRAPRPAAGSAPCEEGGQGGAR